MYYIWKGERVLKGFLVPDLIDGSADMDVESLIHEAIEEDGDADEWLEYYQGEDYSSPWLRGEAMDLRPLLRRFQGTAMVRVDDVITYRLDKRVALPSARAASVNPCAPSAVRSAINSVTALDRNQIESWWESKGTVTTSLPAGVHEYRVLREHCRSRVLIGLFNGVCGTDLGNLDRVNSERSTNHHVAHMICSVVSRSFGSSLRSFYIDEDLTIEQARERANPHIKRVVIEVCTGERSRVSHARICRDAQCLCIRVTISDDLTRADTLRAILNVLKAYGIRALVWFSLPCAGGCPYAKLNAGKSQKAKIRLGEHYTLFGILWK